MQIVTMGLLLVVPVLLVDDEPGLLRSKERFEALVGEYEAKEHASLRTFREAKTDAEKQQIAAEIPLFTAEYAQRFWTLARKDPNAPTAADALYWTARLGRPGPNAEEAIEWLRRDHATSPRMTFSFYKLGTRGDSIA